MAGARQYPASREWLEYVRTGTLPQGKISLTFDDCLRCQYDVALPVLEKFGLTGFWFVYTGHIFDNLVPRLEVYRYFRTARFPDLETFYGRFFSIARRDIGDEVDRWRDSFDRGKLVGYPDYYTLHDCQFREMRDNLLGERQYSEIMDTMIAEEGMDVPSILDKVLMGRDQILDLHRKGHVLGLHSHTHPTTMERLPAERQRQQYESNIADLLRITGVRPQTISHPSNSYSPVTLDILSSLGIRYGFRANVDQLEHGPLELPREDHSTLMRAMTK